MNVPSLYLEGQLLVAMPSMPDPRFERSVIYVCAHSEEGAMGIVVNKPLESLSFSELLEQLEIETSHVDERIRVHFGGPVEAARGFVLHSADYVHDATMIVDDEFALTATVDVLKALAEGREIGKVNIDRYQDVLGPIREEWSMDLARRLVRERSAEEEAET